MNLKKFCGCVIVFCLIALLVFAIVLIHGFAGMISFAIAVILVCIFAFGLKLIIEN